MTTNHNSSKHNRIATNNSAYKPKVGHILQGESHNHREPREDSLLSFLHNEVSATWADSKRLTMLQLNKEVTICSLKQLKKNHVFYVIKHTIKGPK